MNSNSSEEFAEAKAEDLAELKNKYSLRSGNKEAWLFNAALDGRNAAVIELLNGGYYISRGAIRDAIHAAYDNNHYGTGKLIATTLYDKDASHYGLFFIEIGGYLIHIGVDVRSDFYPDKLLSSEKKSSQ